jgi:hypothetical protein
VVLLGDRREKGAARCRGLLGRDDGAERVRYAKSSANLKILLLTVELSLLMLMHRRNTSDMPVQSLAGPPYLAAVPVRHSRSHKV